MAEHFFCLNSPWWYARSRNSPDTLMIDIKVTVGQTIPKTADIVPWNLSWTISHRGCQFGRCLADDVKVPQHTATKADSLCANISRWPVLRRSAMFRQASTMSTR